MTKEELINKHREINVDGDWWYEGVYEWFEEQCHERGVHILSTQRSNYADGQVRMEKDITWSGFWSQGDGAAFSGQVVNLEKALGDRYKDYPILQKYDEEIQGHWSYNWRIGRHNNIIVNGFEYEYLDRYLDDDHPFLELWQGQLEKEIENVEPELSDVAHDLCDLLYKTLQDEYEAMTTDEAVWETIVANELDEEIDDE